MNNKKELYNKIMESVAKLVKKTLNKEFVNYDWYRGVKGARFIDNGEWSDPEIIYEGEDGLYTLNLHEFEQYVADTAGNRDFYGADSDLWDEWFDEQDEDFVEDMIKSFIDDNMIDCEPYDENDYVEEDDDFLDESFTKGIKSLRLNEEFTFEHDELADKIINVIKKNQRIKDITKKSTKDDWYELVLNIINICKNMVVFTNDDMPSRITNIEELAYVIIMQGFDTQDRQIIANYTEKEAYHLASYIDSAKK